MPIKPLDMQVMLPNIRKATKPDHVKHNRNELAEQQQHVKEKEEVETKQNTVQNLEQKDESNIREDAQRKKNEQEKKKAKKKNKEDDETKTTLEKGHGSHFDLKV